VWRLSLAIRGAAMTEPNDLAYLTMRERQSREMSVEPGDVAVKRAHLDIADAYAVRILALKGEP
jgi:hypothetical protein